MWVICGEVPLVWSWTTANDSALLSTASSVLEDVATSNASNTGDFLDDLSTRLWRWVWPLLCVTGLVGNSLVLLVLRQDRLVRTSVNVLLTALAVADSLVLMVVDCQLRSIQFLPGPYCSKVRVHGRVVYLDNYLITSIRPDTQAATALPEQSRLMQRVAVGARLRQEDRRLRRVARCPLRPLTRDVVRYVRCAALIA